MMHSEAGVEAAVCSEAGVEAVACSVAGDKVVMCSGAGIEDNRQRWHRRQAAVAR
jgi:hypothetical protein